MQTARADTVLGKFADTTVTGPGGPIRFFQRAGKYFANTQAAAGQPQDFQILYTFGVYPLQEYLVGLPGGRLQTLGVAWDARPGSQGGQRWFSLYPHQHFSPGEALHWSGRDQTWNFMCADCHSTALRRNYRPDTNTYDTHWAEIDVGCEACHGPGSTHVTTTRQGAAPGSDARGLPVDLHAGRTIQWGLWSDTQKIASPHGDLAAAAAQSESCFACHARRQALTDSPTPGHRFLDDYLPQLLEAGVYRADGQIDAEDFEFGSFVQSKMYRNGVTCTNCHDPHSLKLRAPDNSLCTQCHRADYYDQTNHHHHRAATGGAQCINCHMPQKTYMEVHERRDHSFRIPRPDLTEALGIPNACNQCHRDRSASWADAAITRWTGHPADTATHFAKGIDSAWSGALATDSLLETLAAQPPASGIVRATSLALLSMQQAPLPANASAALAAAATDPDPLVRLGVARGLTGLSAEESLRVGAGLLTDPLRAVRIEAARSLVGIPNDQITATAAARLQASVDELIASERATAERPESHVNIAQIYARLGRADDADRELHTALELDAKFVPAMVNLADLERAQGREDDAEKWLRQAIVVAPRSAEPVHALGLLEVRRGQRDRALDLLAKAMQLDPKNARYAYVYAIALSESGRTQEAASVVTAARRHLPKDASLQDLQRQLTRMPPPAAEHTRAQK